MRSVQFVCHSLCEHNYCKSNQLILFKLGPTNRKNWLTFSEDAVSNTDSGSLFHFPHHCGIKDFRTLIDLLAESLTCKEQIFSVELLSKYKTRSCSRR